ncbi:uncharacterized protein LOC126721578 [Quercus robur]|uniref:uncharacterized protein LOC126721578 n=1 Tax=Quercus robur TaxID=38942 RepID=UPI0021616BF8|nr:uncharacterized protein LOC126721578 [Quercus robur]
MERIRRLGYDDFTFIGFRNWKKVNNGKNCAFFNHVGEDPCSPQSNAVKYCDDLLNESVHIDKVMNVQSSEQILNNQLWVKTSIDIVQWLAFQGRPFSGHDETPESKNRGNFLEMIITLASYNDKDEQVVLENSSKSAKYTSPTIQKEILHVIASKVWSKIREDIGDSKFCSIVDESRDESKIEQMALVLRFANNEGFIQEHFFYLSHVKDTAALTLKNEIYAILSCHYFDIQNICGQGYGGASNMCALVAASREVIPITIVDSSCKRNDELRVAQAVEIARMLAIDELERNKSKPNWDSKTSW